MRGRRQNNDGSQAGESSERGTGEENQVDVNGGAGRLEVFGTSELCFVSIAVRGTRHKVFVAGPEEPRSSRFDWRPIKQLGCT